MQSVIQYRKIGISVRKHVESDVEKTGFRRSQLPHILGDRSAVSTTIKPSSPTEVLPTELEESTTARTPFGPGLGIHPREHTTNEGKGGKVFVVGWEGDDDPLYPRNWSIVYRIWLTLVLALISFVVGAASSADTAILPQAAAEFGVSSVAQSMSIGLYLAGYAVGAIFAGPFSETFGRNVVYISTMSLFMIFIMASALAPNIGAHFAFRFLAGAFGATPLTTAGGSVSDMWPSLEKTYAFPIYAIAGFGGPVLGPVIASYVIKLGSWRWSEWIIVIIAAVIFGLIVLFQPETFPPILLRWKSKHLRDQTGDDRFRSEFEIIETSLWARLKISLTRPFIFALEPIVVCMTLHLTILYIVLFSFLDGYPHVFQDAYGTSQNLTNVIFSGIFAGVVAASFTVPWVYELTKRAFAENTFVPELRLWFAMVGSPAIPISLFWMGWTDYRSVSIWSPIMASVLLGYGIICIFISAYMYIIDAYESYAASALTFVTLIRYMAAGGMTIVGVPMYNNLGTHYTLTLLGCISLLMTPVPYVFYKYGHIIRQRSENAVSWG